jgi:DNA-binding SARP family transcriptional activator/DNA-binding beta-propeller fold protein YncE
MEFRVLGPVEVHEGGRRLPIGAAKQRSLLAILLIHANEAVSADRLIDDLWGEAPPEGASHTLQVYVSQLRKTLEPRRPPGSPGQILTTRGSGYLLQVGDDELDLHAFERLADEGRAALREGRPDVASQKLARALSLWRGPPFADVAREDFARDAVTRAEESHVAAQEDRVEADLACGRNAELVPELRGLVSAHPLRERPWGQLMLALYRAGRQAEALEAYQQARRVLAEELGIDPGPDLQELERGILRQEPALGPVSRRATAVAVVEPAPPEPVPEGPSEAPEPVPPIAARRVGRRPRVVAGGLAIAAVTVAALTTFLVRRGDDSPSAMGPNTVVAIDTGSNEIVDGERVGDGPAGVTVHAGAVWVANLLDGTVSRVDPDRGEVARQGQVGTPTAIASGAEAVWVLDAFNDRLYVIDPRTNTIASSVGVRGRAIAVGFGSVWIVDDVGDRVLRIDPLSLQVEATIRLARDSRPSAVALGKDAVWVANAGTNTVTRIDPSTDVTVADAIALCCRPSGIAAGTGAVWVTSASQDTLEKLDPGSNRVAARFPAGDAPTSVTADDDVWVANTQEGTVVRLDVSGAVVAEIHVEGHPAGIALGDGQVWVTVTGD